MALNLFWRRFLILVAVTAAVVPAVSYSLVRIGLAIGIDVLFVFLFAATLRVLVDARTPHQHNAVGLFFLFLSTYASGAMAYGVETKQIDGWEWILAVLDVSVVLSATAIGTRCFYEAVLLQRAARARRAPRP